MPKQKIEIEIDVPDGWELTGEFRRVNKDDFFIVADGGLVEFWNKSFQSQLQHFIVRKAFTLPDCIPSGWWVAKDANGDIFFYENEPTVNRSRRGWGAGGRLADVTMLFEAHEIDLPNVHWDEAKWQQVAKAEVKDY